MRGHEFRDNGEVLRWLVISDSFSSVSSAWYPSPFDSSEPPSNLDPRTRLSAASHSLISAGTQIQNAFRNKGQRSQERSGTHPIHIQGPEPQKIDDILLARRVLPPLGHLGRTQVVGRVDVAGTPPARQLAHVVVVGLRAADHVLDVLPALGRAAPRRAHTGVQLADEFRRVLLGRALEVEDRRGGVTEVFDWDGADALAGIHLRDPRPL